MGQSMYQVQHYVDVNTTGTATLLDILVNERKRHSVGKVIVAASMSSYGEGAYRCPVHGPVSVGARSVQDMEAGVWEHRSPWCDSMLTPIPTPETWPQAGMAVYAQSKAHQEHLTLAVCGAYEIPAVALRFFNVYGPRQSLSNPYTGVTAIFMSRLKNDNPPVIFEDGLQTRDFISVHDVARGVIAALDSAHGAGASYNLGSGTPVPIRQMAETLARLLDKSIEPEVTGRYRKGDIRHCFADTDRMQNAFDFEPKVSLEEGLSELIEWSRSVRAVDGFEQARQELADRGLA
jgi:dTDP-L-rhamnose 4-epimerase